MTSEIAVASGENGFGEVTDLAIGDSSESKQKIDQTNSS
jgi:hypothetical protein